MKNQTSIHFLITEFYLNLFHNGYQLTETAMLQIYSIVYNYTMKKINSHAYVNKTYNEGKPLNHRNFCTKKKLSTSTIFRQIKTT